MKTDTNNQTRLISPKTRFEQIEDILRNLTPGHLIVLADLQDALAAMNAIKPDTSPDCPVGSKFDIGEDATEEHLRKEAMERISDAGDKCDVEFLEAVADRVERHAGRPSEPLTLASAGDDDAEAVSIREASEAALEGLYRVDDDDVRRPVNRREGSERVAVVVYENPTGDTAESGRALFTFVADLLPSEFVELTRGVGWQCGHFRQFRVTP